MKGRVVVLDRQKDQGSMAALIVDGRLEDLLIDPPGGGAWVGDVHAARVVRKAPGDGAVFVEMDGRQGYLRDGKGLRAGDELTVMVTGLPEPGKALPVTRRVLLKGRCLILTPGAPGVNVSRRIRDPEERARLAEAVLAPGPDVGIIVRSAAASRSAETLAAECATLAARLPGQAPAGDASRPEPALDFALREWTAPLPDMIAAPKALTRTLDWDLDPARFHHDPDLADTLRIGDGDPFDHFGVWDEIERLRAPRGDLPSGGWMAVEATRAMITADVNTADGFGAGDAMTANIEAARELPRQLRLRGLGGQIVIDFAPLKKMHRKKIEEELKRAFRHDPVETTLAGWTPLGNFELTRKRERRPLSELLP